MNRFADVDWLVHSATGASAEARTIGRYIAMRPAYGLATAYIGLYLLVKLATYLSSAPVSHSYPADGLGTFAAALTLPSLLVVAPIFGALGAPNLTGWAELVAAAMNALLLVGTAWLVGLLRRYPLIQLRAHGGTKEE
ncbi:MAG: hypothetical protein AAF581_10295 [Planctomycetota bacterium]